MEGATYDEELKPRIGTKKEDQGITMRCIEMIFQLVDQMNLKTTEEHNWKYSVECSFMQIYQEKIFDLLNTQSRMMQ